MDSQAPKRGLKCILLCTVFLSATATGVIVLHSRARTPLIEIEPRYLSFGTVWEDENFQWEFPVRNVSRSALAIVDWNTSCGCVSIEPKPCTLRPNETRTFRATFNLLSPVAMERDLNSSTQSVGTISVSPKLTIANIVPPTFYFSGIIRKVLSLSNREFDLVGTRKLARGTPNPPLTVHVSSRLHLDELRATCSKNFAHADVTERLGDTNAFDVAISLDDPPTGPFAFTVNVIPFVRGEELPSRDIRITGETVGEIYCIPDCILLGAAAIGQQLQDTVCIVSTRGSDIIVESVDVNGSDVTVSSESQAGADRCVYRISSTVSSPGRKDASAVFHLRHGANETMILHLPITWHGFVLE